MGRLILADSGPIYLDANAVIYRVEGVEPYFSASNSLWKEMDDGRCQVITSELTWFEVMVKPIQDGDDELVDMFGLILFMSNLECRAINLQILKKAATLRASHRLKTPDAIHAATALIAGATMFLTNDAGFRRVPGLPVVLFDEVVASEHG